MQLMVMETVPWRPLHTSTACFLVAIYKFIVSCVEWLHPAATLYPVFSSAPPLPLPSSSHLPSLSTLDLVTETLPSVYLVFTGLCRYAGAGGMG